MPAANLMQSDIDSPAGEQCGSIEPASGTRHEARSLPGLLILLAAEGVLAALHIKAGLGTFGTLLAHGIIVSTAAYRLVGAVPAGRDITPAALAVLATAVAGPVGTLASLILVAAARPRSDPNSLIADWHARIALSAEIDPVTALCDNVTSGRTMNLAAPPPSIFLDVITHGAVGDQQTALGLIARRFHPDYLPALSQALKSAEPVVRVQAAAVAARIRDQLASRVRELVQVVETASPGTEARVAAARRTLQKALASGLLDEAERRRAEAALSATSDEGKVAGAASAPTALGQSGLDQQQLLAMGHFRAFRIARRHRRISRLGPYRIRVARPRDKSGGSR